MCVVPAGAQPLLPAKLLPGMGSTKRFRGHDEVGRGAQILPAGRLADPFVLVHGVGALVRAGGAARSRHGDGALVHRAQRRERLPSSVPAAAQHRERRRRPRRGAGDASGDAVQRTTNGAAVNPQVRAREAIAKAMALRDKVTERERLYIESQAARRAPGNKDDADAAYIAGLRKLVAAYPDDLDAKSMLGLAHRRTASTRSARNRARTRWKRIRAARRSGRGQTTRISARITT